MITWICNNIELSVVDYFLYIYLGFIAILSFSAKEPIQDTFLPIKIYEKN